jgi:hypothetical protein
MAVEVRSKLCLGQIRHTYKGGLGVNTGGQSGHIRYGTVLVTALTECMLSRRPPNAIQSQCTRHSSLLRD